MTDPGFPFPVWVAWALTLALELPWFLLAFRQATVGQRCALAVCANLVSYPWVTVIFPAVFSNYDVYLGVSEAFAPLVEGLWCGWALGRRLTPLEWVAVVLANLFSWKVGLWAISAMAGYSDNPS